MPVNRMTTTPQQIPTISPPAVHVEAVNSLLKLTPPQHETTLLRWADDLRAGKNTPGAAGLAEMIGTKAGLTYALNKDLGGTLLTALQQNGNSILLSHYNTRALAQNILQNLTKENPSLQNFINNAKASRQDFSTRDLSQHLRQFTEVFVIIGGLIGIINFVSDRQTNDL